MANPLDLLAFAKRAWETTNQPLKERASVLPLGQYEDGSVGLAWPGLLAAPAEGVANFGSQGFGEDAVPYNSRMAFDAAGGAMTGGLGVGLAGGMADDAVRAGKSAADDWLDLYHGTTTPTQFDKLSMKHATNRSERAIFAADVPDFANQFASDEYGRIFKIRVPRDQIMDFDMSKAYSRDPFEVAMDDAYDAGKGVVRFKTISDRPTYAIRNPDVIRYLNDPLYSNAPTGSSIPLAMNALERTAADLPMDLASRMQRAREMGFDTERVLYHGTKADFSEFDPTQGSTPGSWFTKDQAAASQFGEASPYVVRASNPATLQDLALARRVASGEPGTPEFNADVIRILQGAGFDSVSDASFRGAGGSGEGVVSILDPRNIRSVNAAFDPSKSDSANLLAANAPSSASVPLAMNALERTAADLPMDLASRMQRAREMGFDTENTIYRGMTRPMEGDGMRPASGGYYGPGVYGSTEPGVASAHTGSYKTPPVEGGNITPMFARGRMATMDDLEAATIQAEAEGLAGSARDARANEILAERGYSGVRDQDIFNIFDPRNIRSVNAAFDPSRSDSANLLAANAKSGAAVPLAIDAAERSTPQGIRAYHGSPHDFDRFSLDKIGTGEGAQAYGHGLYFAESEGVARSYRDNLAQPINPLSDDEIQGIKNALDSVRTNNPNIAAGSNARDALELAQENLADLLGRDPTREELIEELTRKLGKGRMYEVNIKANPEDFLDWDKPLSQQSEAVRNAFAQYGIDANETGSRAYDLAGAKAVPVPKEDYSWTSFVNVVNDTTTPMGRVKVADALREAGIPGIKYLDGMSRDGGAGTSNYVVFDDQLVDILRKYANAPTGAAVPLGMEGAEQDGNPALLEQLRMLGLY